MKCGWYFPYLPQTKFLRWTNKLSGSILEYSCVLDTQSCMTRIYKTNILGWKRIRNSTVVLSNSRKLYRSGTQSLNTLFSSHLDLPSTPHSGHRLSAKHFQLRSFPGTNAALWPSLLYWSLHFSFREDNSLTAFKLREIYEFTPAENVAFCQGKWIIAGSSPPPNISSHIVQVISNDIVQVFHKS